MPVVAGDPLPSALKGETIAVCTQLSIQIYSYFEKGCRKKYTRQSRKVLWVVLSALFSEEI